MAPGVWRMLVVLCCMVGLCVGSAGSTVSAVDSVLASVAPIIGVLAVPIPTRFNRTGSFINADYVKWLWGAGARVAVIPHDASPKKQEELFNSVNGLLYQGGDTDLITSETDYYKAAYALFQLALRANDKGDYFPVHGTCLGFELLAIMVSHNFSLLGTFDAERESLAIEFTPEAQHSRMFGSLPWSIRHILETEKVSDNFHHNGVSPTAFRENPALVDFFRVLSLNHDKKGVPFVSSFEGWKYPVYGVQHHPERVLSEFTPEENINHSYDSILAAQYASDFFVNEARRSQHHFASEKSRDAALINNYPMEWVGPTIPFVNQVYLLPCVR